MTAALRLSSRAGAWAIGLLALARAASGDGGPLEGGEAAGGPGAEALAPLPEDSAGLQIIIGSVRHSI